jgi:hypothetical protein
MPETRSDNIRWVAEDWGVPHHALQGFPVPVKYDNYDGIRGSGMMPYDERNL